MSKMINSSVLERSGLLAKDAPKNPTLCMNIGSNGRILKRTRLSLAYWKKLLNCIILLSIPAWNIDSITCVLWDMRYIKKHVGYRTGKKRVSYVLTKIGERMHPMRSDLSCSNNFLDTSQRNERQNCYHIVRIREPKRKRFIFGHLKRFVWDFASFLKYSPYHNVQKSAWETFNLFSNHICI